MNLDTLVARDITIRRELRGILLFKTAQASSPGLEKSSWAGEVWEIFRRYWYYRSEKPQGKGTLWSIPEDLSKTLTAIIKQYPEVSKYIYKRRAPDTWVVIKPLEDPVGWDVGDWLGHLEAVFRRNE